MNSLSSKSLIIWRIRATLISAIAMFVSGGIFVFSVQLGAIFAAVTIIIYIIAVTLYLPLLYKNYKYSVNSNNIHINKGIILIRSINIDRKKIQYCELRQSPLQKIFKTAAIKVYTCGTYVIISQADLIDAKKYMRKAD